MKSLFGRISKLTIFALAISLAAPVPSAQSADETVTKTFVVRDFNNNLVQNALVRVWWYDVSKQENNYATPIVTTDANGSVSVDVAKSLVNVSYQVFPPAGDVVNAAPAFSWLSTATSETIQVKFLKANFKVQVKDEGGINDVGSSDKATVTYPNAASGSSQSSYIIRTGAFGIALPSDLLTANNYFVGVLQFVPWPVQGRFSWRYGLKAAGAAGSQTYTIYEDMNFQGTVSPNGSGVYVLSYKPGNLTGKIKDVNGNAIAMPANSRGTISIQPDFPNAPLNSGSGTNFAASTSPDASWSARLSGPAGRYKVNVSFTQTSALPSFVTYIWKNSAGGFSLSENGPFTNAPHVLDIRIPGTANLNFTVKSPDATPVDLPASFNLNVVNGGWMMGHFSNDGKFSLVVPNGNYVMNVFPSDSKYISFDVGVSVQNGVVSITQGGATLVTTAANTWELKPRAPNFKYKVVSETSTSVTLVGTDIQITKGSTGKGDQVFSKYFDGIDGSTYLADGEYTVAVNPGGRWWTTYDRTLIPLTVSGGNATITGLNADVTTKVFSLPIKAKNFLYKIVQASDTATTLAGGWIDYCKVNSLDNPTSYTDCRGEGTDQNGLGGALLDNGFYIMNVNPGSNSIDARRTYKVTVADRTVSSITPLVGAAVVQDSGRYKLFGSPANLTGSLKLTGGTTNVTFGQNQNMLMSMQKWNESRKNWDWFGSNFWRNTATFSFNLDLTQDGKYRVLAKPYGFENLASAYSEEFNITGGQFVAPAGATLGAGGTSLTNLNVSLKVPNFKILMVDPRDNSLMKNGWVSVIKKETNREYWIENIDLNSQNPGIAGTNLGDGTYKLEVNPQMGDKVIAGLARQYYNLTVSGSTLTLTLGGTTISPDATTGRFTMRPASSNISGQVVDAAGTSLIPTNGKWISINVQKWQASGKYWEWTPNWANVDGNGFFSISVREAGKYRLRIEPQGFANSTTTYSNEFTIDAGQENDFSLAFGAIKMITPSLKVQVALPGTTTPLNYVGIEMRKNGNFLDWNGTGPQGTAMISFADAGTYEIVVHPNSDQLNAGLTKRTYTVVATKNSEGVITAAITGVTKAEAGHFTVTFATGSLQGFVYAPGTTTGVQNSNVVAVDTTTQREMWDYSANTSPTGKWTMSLPAGTYNIYARAPWGSNLYGNSDLITGVTVDANGVATVTGRTATSLNIELKTPRWTGTVKAPASAGDIVIPFATLCLYTNDVWTCTNANENGQWAMSGPTAFTGSPDSASAFSTNAILEIRDDRNRAYPMLRFNGNTAVYGALGVSGAKTFNLNSTNFRVKVTAGSKDVSNVWVSVDAPNKGWLGGAVTDASGIASLYIDTATVTTNLNVRVDVNGNKEISGAYAPTNKTFAIDDVKNANGSYIGTVPLDSPNFLGVVREPSVGDVTGAAVQWSWVELFDETNNGRWVGGANTNESGAFAMNIPRPTSGAAIEYTLVVNPQWNSSTNSSRRQYKVMMPVSGDPTVTLKSSGAAIATTQVNGVAGYYALPLAAPSVTGTVVNPSDVGVRDSWVVPISSTTGEYFWQQGMNSKSQGSFSMALDDGTYKIEANVPWNTANLARSAQCAITVSGGAVTTAAGGCVQSNGSLKLALRSPNVTLTLKKAGIGVAYAWVNIGVGNWRTGAQSNSEGKVSLFVDRQAILAANPNLAAGSHDIWVWVDPPYGSSDMVRWNCASGDNKPLCQNLVDFNTASDYAAISAFDVTMPEPNTKLKVVSGATGIKNSWVSIFRFETTNVNQWSWIGGSNTDADGWAAFNIDTSTATANTRYKIEVNAPWDQRATYAQKWHGNDSTGLTWLQINNQSFAIGTPNLKLTVLSPQLAGSKWGWVALEEVNVSNQVTSWVGSFGLDNNGVTALTIQANKRYKLTAYPGTGRAGTRTECIITTNGSEVVGALDATLCNAGSALSLTGSLNAFTITLKAGNLTGTVKDPSGKAVAGAIVYANVAGVDNEDLAQTVVTLADGKFGFQVDTTKTWVIKIFPANDPTGTQLANKTVSAITFSGSSKELGDISLVVK